jgi:hypothetical protein
VYIIKGALRPCISSRASVYSLRLDDIQRQAVDDIPQQVADDIQGLRLDFSLKV